MILLHGIYKFGKKRIAFRNDFCNHCKAQHVAEQYRTFNMWHVFFVPLIPLGYCSNWHCTACGNDPRERTKESPTLLIIGMALFGLVGILGLFGAITAKKDRFMMLMVGSGFLAASFGCWAILRWQQNEPDGPNEKVEPLTGDTCPYCSGKIVETPHCHCSECGVRRY